MSCCGSGIRSARGMIPWIRQADRDLRPAGAAKSGEPVITKIEVYDWARPKPEAEKLNKALEAYQEA